MTLAGGRDETRETGGGGSSVDALPETERNQNFGRNLERISFDLGLVLPLRVEHSGPGHIVTVGGVPMGGRSAKSGLASLRPIEDRPGTRTQRRICIVVRRRLAVISVRPTWRTVRRLDEDGVAETAEAPRRGLFRRGRAAS